MKKVTMKKKLELTKTHLRQLAADELNQVAGGERITVITALPSGCASQCQSCGCPPPGPIQCCTSHA